jgi:FkbM family methyltransferase
MPMSLRSPLVEPPEEQSTLPNSVIDYLAQQPDAEVSPEQRTEIVQRCRDADYIPKVKGAGKVFTQGGKKYQLMHNGIKVMVDGYYGAWNTDLIEKMQGHHEPQEEKVFYELSKHFTPGTAMIELGAYWAFYSLWFHKVVPNAFNICCEPDSDNKLIGETNFKLNTFTNYHFIDAAAGSTDGERIDFVGQESGKVVTVPIRTVDSVVAEYNIDKLEVLHMDVQGQEYEALLGAEQTIKEGKLRFVFISTHHYLISRDPNIHARCIEFIKGLGAHIIAEHDVHESFSGDGLIVASFAEKDKKLSVDVSRNRMATSQFRSYTNDMDIAFGAYEIQLQRALQRSRLQQHIESLEDQLQTATDDINYLASLNIKASTKQVLKAIYRSIRFRTLRLIWGTAGYANSKALDAAAVNNVSDKVAAQQLLQTISASDAANLKLVVRSNSFRAFVYEALRHLLIIIRRVIDRPKKDHHE